MFDWNKAQGFIFDCDGTLLDTIPTWIEAEAPLYAQAGPMSSADEDVIHAALVEDTARIFHENYGVGESTQAVLDHLESVLMPFYTESATALPGAIEFVEEVNRRDLPMVLVSSSPRRYLEAGLRRVGLLDYFQQIITPEVAGCPKTDPQIFTYALEVLGTPADATWGVDDALYAVRVMNGLGIPTIGITGEGEGERAEALKTEATIAVSSLAELL